MYTDYYGLTDDPFAPQPDPRYFFESPGHKRALAYLRYGLGQGEGTVIITGPRGIGKTTLIHRLARSLRSPGLVPVHLLIPPGGLEGVTRVVGERLGLPVGNAPAGAVLRALESHLVTLRQSGTRAQLVLDEAQNLSPRELQVIEGLLGARVGSLALLPALLFAESEFRDTLRAPERRGLRQCACVAYQLNPLSLEETIAYVRHRLGRVGWKDDPAFLPLAHLELFFLSLGIPGRINDLCHHVLSHAAEQGLHEIKAETVATASTRLAPEPEDRRPW
jgi:type II secretory pathway predicted ATPase ExeA